MTAGPEIRDEAASICRLQAWRRNRGAWRHGCTSINDRHASSSAGGNATANKMSMDRNSLCRREQPETRAALCVRHVNRVSALKCEFMM
jgi:hypothetical protein